MNNSRIIEIKILKDLGIYKSGDIVKVEADLHGTPRVSYWRDRLKDSLKDQCCEVIKPVKKTVSKTVTKTKKRGLKQ